MKYRLTVAYRGTAYAGWQRQPNGLAVQEVLEQALERFVESGGDAPGSVRTVAAGRTDAGVHAEGQAVSLSLQRQWPTSALIHGTNRLLPDDVRVMAAAPAPSDFDARRDARAKEYRYRLRPAAVLSPLEAPYVVRVSGPLELERMAAATDRLVGRHDFSAFAKSGGAHSSPVRTIFEAEWAEERGRFRFRVVGDGFLRGMVRAIVGTLVEVGGGKRSIDDIDALRRGADRAAAGPTAPARGLVLQRVEYPDRVLAFE